jgi:hypothetical protein
MKPQSEYPTLEEIPLGVPVEILRDGHTLTIAPDANAAFVWIARHATQSVSYSLKHGGYSCRRLQS